jgi:hypothetical protein
MNHIALEYPAGAYRMGFTRATSGSLVTTLASIWLVVMMPMLALRLPNLPHNLILADFWIAAGMVVFSLLFIGGRQTILVTPYVIPIWLILLGSLISTFAATSASRSLLVVLKEGYLFAWFFTMTVLMARLGVRPMRWLMWAWLATALLHGGLIIGQLLSSDLWRFCLRLGNQMVEHSHYRPSGLFITASAGNANKAAFFQLLGFVPLLYVSRSQVLTVLFGTALTCSILATGSMGATVALMAGVIVGVIAALLLAKDVLVPLRTLLGAAVAAIVVGAVVWTALDDANRRHVEGIIFDRAEKSSGGRMALWQRGVRVLVQRDDPLLAGVGPENFRVLDGRGNQLHNDLLAFVVERGTVGGIGLIVLGGMAFWRASLLLPWRGANRGEGSLRSVVFLAAMAAVAVESLTHQVFHSRELWVLLAAQEGLVYQSRFGPSIPLIDDSPV